MDDPTISQPLPPHLIVFPSPLQWPVTTMFDSAELLSLSGLDVTFLLTPYTHTLLLHHFHIDSRFNPYPNIHLHTISDGLPPDHPRSDATELLASMETLTKPNFTELLSSGRLIDDERGPVSCIVSDGFMSFVYDVAKEMGVPVISVLSLSPCSLWVLSNLPNPTVQVSGISEGVPTICCPSSLDQQVNSRFVSKAWKIGLDVEWRWERKVIEKMIRDVMGSKGELIEKANKMKYLGRKSVRKGGSSYAMLEHLINDIIFMHNGSENKIISSLN